MTHDRFFQFFSLIDSEIIENLLKYRVYYFLSNLSIDRVKFFLNYLKFRDANYIVENIIIYIIFDDLNYCFNHYLVAFKFLIILKLY